jgi:thiol-disulfide isomerase/thioredoxin
LRGRPLLLNFWASWCEPCRAEMPSLELLESRHASAGLKVLAINFRETDGTVKRFVEQTGLSLTVLRDRDGGTARDYGVKIYPTTIAVDRAGRARFSVTGEVDWLGPDAARWLRPLLESRAK